MTVAMIGYAVARVVGQQNVASIDIKLRGPLYMNRRVRVSGELTRTADGLVAYRCSATTDQDELLAEGVVVVRSG
jgi:hypothetical protein